MLLNRQRLGEGLDDLRTSGCQSQHELRLRKLFGLIGHLDTGCALPAQPGAPLSDAAAVAAAAATRRLLAVAERYYASADAGLVYLSPRCALAVRAARLIYARIGHEVERKGCDPRAGRAIVPRATKVWLALRACGALVWGLIRTPRGAVTLPSACLQSDPILLPAWAPAGGAVDDRGGPS